MRRSGIKETSIREIELDAGRFYYYATIRERGTFNLTIKELKPMHGREIVVTGWHELKSLMNSLHELDRKLDEYKTK